MKVFFSESAEISYCFETFTFTGLSFKRVRKIRPAINWDNQTSSSDLMAIECFPIGGNIPLYPFLLKAIYVLENIIRNHHRKATQTTLAVEPANFLRFLRLAVKVRNFLQLLAESFLSSCTLNVLADKPQFNFF